MEVSSYLSFFPVNLLKVVLVWVFLDQSWSSSFSTFLMKSRTPETAVRFPVGRLLLQTQRCWLSTPSTAPSLYTSLCVRGAVCDNVKALGKWPVLHHTDSWLHPPPHIFLSHTHIDTPAVMRPTEQHDSVARESCFIRARSQCKQNSTEESRAVMKLWPSCLRDRLNYICGAVFVFWCNPPGGL